MNAIATTTSLLAKLLALPRIAYLRHRLLWAERDAVMHEADAKNAPARAALARKTAGELRVQISNLGGQP